MEGINQPRKPLNSKGHPMHNDPSDGVPVEFPDDADTKRYLRQYIHVIDISDGVPLEDPGLLDTQPSLPTETHPTTGIANN